VKEAAAQVLTISQIMTRSNKAAAAVEQELNRKFRAYQQELGISLDDDGEE
jgi:hypothetical protein